MAGGPLLPVKSASYEWVRRLGPIHIPLTRLFSVSQSRLTGTFGAYNCNRVSSAQILPLQRLGRPLSLLQRLQRSRRRPSPSPPVCFGSWPESFFLRPHDDPAARVHRLFRLPVPRSPPLIILRPFRPVKGPCVLWWGRSSPRVLFPTQ